ncbi:hypothetical protein JKF63_01228 [Porcisia hertigi]|uniref:Transmembrane protein n=1 Tax=Porcisia hertigi TaxID=2761500 RepID=A0A836KZF0_9TRYP|nr:hypothetical protein JKF63_01228 [Porcisia hertigi]
MRRVWMCKAAAVTLAIKRPPSVVSCWSATYTTSSSELCRTALVPCECTLTSTRRETLGKLSPLRYGGIGTGGSSPALFRLTRVTRIPPQLARLVMAGGAALLQVFWVAYQRESQKLRQEEQSRGADGATQGVSAMGRSPVMSPAEAVQVLGLDSSFPDLLTSVQRVSSSSTLTPASLPLAPGEARMTAQQNFERMFALAVKEGNMFLAGKLSAAYRICVDPKWDQTMSGGEEATTDTNKQSTTEANGTER